MLAIAWEWDLLLLLLVPALVALNGLFVAAEFSLVAVRRTRIEELVRHNRKGAKAVEQAVAHLTRSIAATQLGITLASLGLGAVGEPTLARLLKAAFGFLPEIWGELATHSVAVVCAFMAITFMHIVFGEIIPKAVTIRQPDRMALWLAKPLLVFGNLARPLIVIINGTANAILRCCNMQSLRDTSMVHSVEELTLLIEDTEEAGILDSDQAEFVQNVFHLSNKRVRDCMVPREKMGTLDVHSSQEKVLEAARRGAHTRMPVYDGELDNIVGIVNTKDLFYLFSLSGVVVLEDALYPASFLKPDEEVANALRLFRKSHRPMALVRDDNNKILGLITLEDILEEIVGDIEDEHDRPTPKLVIRRARKSPAKLKP
jgi:CBS domain containing-hemolysin-like protein